MKQTHRDLVEMSSTGINFPRLGIAHSPQLDLSIIGAGNDEWEGWMERSPVHSTVVLEDMAGNAQTSISSRFHFSFSCFFFLGQPGELPLTPSRTYLT
jgi:hypothetical protein